MSLHLPNGVGSFVGSSRSTWPFLICFNSLHPGYFFSSFFLASADFFFLK